MKKLIPIIALVALALPANAFVLIGPADPGGFEESLAWPGAQGGVASANMTDDLGTPKELDQFYRWTTPHLTYGFDSSFVQQ